VTFDAPQVLAADTAGNIVAVNGGSDNLLLLAIADDTVYSIWQGYATYYVAFNGTTNTFWYIYINGSGDLVLAQITAGGVATDITTYNGLISFAYSAVDGNMYLFDNSNNMIMMDSQSYAQTTVATLPEQYVTAAIDSNGNVYVANGDTIYQTTITGATPTAFVTVPGVNITQVILNASNTLLYFTDYVNGVIYSVTPAGQSTQFGTVPGSFGLAIGTDGYLYASGATVNAMYRSTSTICFNADTTIRLADRRFVRIDELRVGDLVQTYMHGLRRVTFVHSNRMINNTRLWDQTMHRMRATPDNGMSHDLLITGGHSVLVRQMSLELTRKNRAMFDGGVIPKIDDLFLLRAAASPDFEPVIDENVYTYYHILLEPETPGDADARFGVYCNGDGARGRDGVLCETPSLNQLQFHLGREIQL
jgi:hypothetical protein